MKNKNVIKILFVVLSVICLCSAFSSLAFAEGPWQNYLDTFVQSGENVRIDDFITNYPPDVDSIWVDTENGKSVLCYPSLNHLLDIYGDDYDLSVEFVVFACDMAADDCSNYRLVYYDDGDISYSGTFSLWGFDPFGGNMQYFLMDDGLRTYSAKATISNFSVKGRIDYADAMLDDFEKSLIGSSDSYVGIEHVCSGGCDGFENYYFLYTNPHKHIGGVATCTEKAVCRTCGEEYGSALGHNYGELISREEVHTPDRLEPCIAPHYYCDRCDTYFNESYDFVSSFEALVGATPEHIDGDNNARCDVCDVIMPDHIHSYSSEWITDGEYHWFGCICGLKTDLGEHNGGRATCYDGAKCSQCGVIYTEPLEHNYTEATCTKRAKCTYCGEYKGSVLDHHDDDKNSICDECGFLLIGSEEYQQMEHFDFNNPSNMATSFYVGEQLFYSLWHDDVDHSVRNYYLSLCYAPDDYHGVDTYYQESTRFVNYVDTIQGGGRVYGLQYNRAYFDSGSQPAYLYNPYTDSLYNRIEVIITFYKNGAIASEYDVSAITYSGTTESGFVRTINGFMFNSPGTYDVTIYVKFINDFDDTFEVMSSPEQTFSVELSNTKLKEQYDNGFADGYKVGFENGSISDDDFSFYGFINAIINAPADFIDGMLDFNVFGVNMASFVKLIFTLLLVAFVVFCILKVVI